MAELDSTKVVDNCESGDQNSDAMSLGYETLSERLGWWKLNQEFSRRAEPWRSSAPEKLHPRLLALFSAVLDTICWCLVGIDLLYMVFALLVISATFFSIGFLCIIHGLMGGIPADSSRAFHWKETDYHYYVPVFWPLSARRDRGQGRPNLGFETPEPRNLIQTMLLRFECLRS